MPLKVKKKPNETLEETVVRMHHILGRKPRMVERQDDILYLESQKGPSFNRNDAHIVKRFGYEAEIVVRSV